MKYLDQGQSIVFLSAHFNNWEWLLLSTSLNLPVPADVVYKPLHSESADQFMYESRSRFGVDPISMKNFANEVIRRKRQQRVYCILADQKPRGDSKAHITEFLNRETRFFLGPEKIAQFAKIPVLFVRTLRVARGYYKIEIIPIGEPPYEKRRDCYPMTERYVREVEAMIHAQPESYLWGHKRWKGQPPVSPPAEQPASDP
jgi:KDO2-lipid IV(A) lauroyltransferase